MGLVRVRFPKLARHRTCVPWRLIVDHELSRGELMAVCETFLSGTRYHMIVKADSFPGRGYSVIDGDYWPSRGDAKDMSKVARLWEAVEALYPRLLVRPMLAYRVPYALVDKITLSEVNK